MDKYKTSEMGQSLKKVYRGESTISDSVHLVEKEIRSVFDRSKDVSVETDTNIGLYGESAGKCPLCDGEVVRTKFGYGCSNFRNGCKFTVSKTICQRTISISNIRMLLSSGRTSKIQGFISKSGKSFDAVLKLEDGKVVFDFGVPQNNGK